MPRVPGKWIKFHLEGVITSPHFHPFFEGKRAAMLYDPEKGLFGLKPLEIGGYRFTTRDGLRSRQIPQEIPRKRYVAEWSEDLQAVICDLKQPIE